MHKSGLGVKCWAKAAYTACYLINRSPASAIGFKCPNKVWNNQPVAYSHLKIFGCAAYMHDNVSKLDPRAKKCVLWAILVELKDTSYGL